MSSGTHPASSGRILVVDDQEVNLRVVSSLLSKQGYEVVVAGSGEDAGFRAFMHITGIQQGGVQFALRLKDQPGLIKEVVDLLRARGARFVCLLTSYATAREGHRDVYIRVKNLSPEGTKDAKEELASR